MWILAHSKSLTKPSQSCASIASTHKDLCGICSVWCNGCMKHPPTPQAFAPVVNRVSDMMAHSTRYAFHGVTRLAADARVSASSVSRLINGKMNPSFAMVARITTALERVMGYRIDPRDLVAELGRFLTPHTCDLAGCQGCLPENASDEFGDIKPAFEGVKPGQWVTSRYPKGYQETRKGGSK